MSWFFVRVFTTSLSWRWRVNRLWVSAPIGSFSLRGLNFPIHTSSSFHGFDPVKKCLLFVICKLHILVLILLVLKLLNLTWWKMSHPLFDWHLHDLRESKFVRILRNEFIHLLRDLLGPELLFVIYELLLVVIDSGWYEVLDKWLLFQFEHLLDFLMNFWFQISNVRFNFIFDCVLDESSELKERVKLYCLHVVCCAQWIHI